MELFLKAILDLLDGTKTKAEMLVCAKSICRLKEEAKLHLAKMSEDECDELALNFGEKLFDLLRGEK